MRTLSDKKNIAIGLVFTYIALVVSIIGSLVVTPIVLNNIGDDNYGLFSFCNSITSWLALVSTSLGASYIFFVNKDLKEKGCESGTNTVFKRILFLISGIVVIISLLTVGIMKLTGLKFSNYSDEQNDIILLLLLISGIQVAISIFFSVFSLYNNYKKSFAFVRGFQIIFSVLSYAANLVLAITTKSIIAIACVSFAGAFLTGIINLIYAIKVRKMHFEKTKIGAYKSEIPNIIKYSSIILLSAIIGNLDSNLDKTLLGAMVDAESVTMYQLSITFASHLLVVAYSFTEVMRPTIYSYYRNNKIDEVNNLFLNICKMQSVVVLLIIGGFIACGYHFVIMWISQKRIAVYFYSLALFVSNIVPLTDATIGEAYRATNHQKMPLLFSCISIIINLFLTVILIIVLDNRYAVWACIIGTIFPRIIFGYCVNPIYAYKKIGLPMGKYYLNLLKDLVIAVIAIFPSIVLTFVLNDVDTHNFVKVLIEGFSFVIVYSVGIVIFEKETIKNIINAYIKRQNNMESNSGQEEMEHEKN